MPSRSCREPTPGPAPADGSREVGCALRGVHFGPWIRSGRGSVHRPAPGRKHQPPASEPPRGSTAKTGVDPAPADDPDQQAHNEHQQLRGLQPEIQALTEGVDPVSYTHLRAHETDSYLV